MNRINRYLLLLLFLLFSNLLISQGLVESPLSSNPVLIQKWNELQEQHVFRSSTIPDTISIDSIPFLDDFSYEGPYPDTSLWLDDKVYINRGYPIAPISIGVATFDGLDANGYAYKFGGDDKTSGGQADYLTSKPIDLKFPAGDSIYFSFYYQPQGRGNDPEQNDSLVLQFKVPGGWKNVWAKKGSTLASSDSSWTYVLIPITDPAFLIKGFQFRFKNYATLSGNLDHWNIDYVYLNKIRRYNEPFNDVSFVYDPAPLIKTYSSMPWNHYNSNYRKDSVNVVWRNNDASIKNVNYFHKVYDQSGGVVYSTPVPFPANNVFPFSTAGYFTYKAVLPLFSTTTNPTEYTFETIIENSGLFDTLHYVQTFSNYYAYDDGTAESAFGLSRLNSLLAEQFTSTITDTLRCIDIYFNPILTNAELYTFRLKVWGDNGGIPGTVLYTSDKVLSPAYNLTGYNQFSRYYLSSPLVLGAGTFYIGFQQNTDQFLNVGVDKNINTQLKVFYNITGTWNNSPKTGSLMMHPVFGSAADFTGIANVVKKENQVIVYPNPANDKLYLESNAVNVSGNFSYSIIDLYGRSVIQNNTPDTGPIDITMLSEGVYFIRIVNKEYTSTTRFIKVN